jgi:low temperature requirement protein LtrA
MYGGYVWLTNYLPPNRTSLRLLLLLGMPALLIQGLAIPHVFGDEGLVFGLAYLAVVLVHSGLFRVATRAIDRTVLFNIGSVLPIIAAGRSLGGAAEYCLWRVALLV